MKTAGTNETFCLKFLRFDHEDQRWTAECQVGKESVTLAGNAGNHRWYVVGYPKVQVPQELTSLLSRLTHCALADWQKLDGYRKAVGEFPSGVIQ